MIGRRFGKLVVVELALTGKRSDKKWKCVCDCWNTSVVFQGNLNRGLSRSCGCGQGPLKHGGARNGQKRALEYMVWSAMKDRCTNANNPKFEHYGGRGITVCDAWLNSYESFIADMGKRPDGGSKLTIERLNNDAGYDPGNCVWATYKQQNNNRRKADRPEFAYFKETA